MDKAQKTSNSECTYIVTTDIATKYFVTPIVLYSSSIQNHCILSLPITKYSRIVELSLILVKPCHACYRLLGDAEIHVSKVVITALISAETLRPHPGCRPGN
jgi:hypothetical protein